ncbi:MAG: DUF3027 domain-containing protein [Micrococcaceae bacterium]
MSKHKIDALLTESQDYARAVLETVTAPESIGNHIEVVPEGRRAVSHYFECLLPGYPGWRWVVVLSRHARSKEILVNETELVAGEDSLLAPKWVPWSDRISEEEKAEFTEGTVDAE